MKISKPYLPKTQGWAIFTALLFIDAFIDVVRGAEGNPIWIPIVNAIGINFVPLLVPLILPLYYAAVKVLGAVAGRVDRTPHAEEIILTALVVVYALFDAWLVASGFLGFRLIKNFYQTIPFLIIAGLAYALWAQHKVGKRK